MPATPPTFDVPKVKIVSEGAHALKANASVLEIERVAHPKERYAIFPVSLGDHSFLTTQTSCVNDSARNPKLPRRLSSFLNIFAGKRVAAAK